MGTILDSKIALQKFLRWMILRMLYAARPGGASEIIMPQVLQSMEFDCELNDVRQDMDYMCAVGLAEAGQDDLTGCRARLTALGVAVVDCSVRHRPSEKMAQF